MYFTDSVLHEMVCVMKWSTCYLQWYWNCVLMFKMCSQVTQQNTWNLFDFSKPMSVIHYLILKGDCSVLRFSDLQRYYLIYRDFRFRQELKLIFVSQVTGTGTFSCKSQTNERTDTQIEFLTHRGVPPHGPQPVTRKKTSVLSRSPSSI